MSSGADVTIKLIHEDSPFVEEVIRLADENKATLGFNPQLNVEDYILVYESSPKKILRGWFEVRHIEEITKYSLSSSYESMPQLILKY